MLSRVAADVVVAFHFAFLLFLAAGSLLAWRWPRLVAFHLPSVAWGVVSITAGLDCPLTPLEKQLRRSAGEQGYAGGFVDRYIEGVVYPEQYTPLLRVLIATAVVVGYLALIRRFAASARHWLLPAPAAVVKAVRGIAGVDRRGPGPAATRTTRACWPGCKHRGRTGRLSSAPLTRPEQGEDAAQNGRYRAAEARSDCCLVGFQPH